MCAINPKRQQHFILSVYTSRDMSAEEFQELVNDKALNTEIALNADGRLRWHLKPKSWRTDKIDKIMALSDAGKSAREIEAELGYASRHVHYVIRTERIKRQVVKAEC